MEDKDVIGIMDNAMVGRFDQFGALVGMDYKFDISTIKPDEGISYIEIENRAQLRRILPQVNAPENILDAIESRIKAHPEQEKIYILLPR